MGGMDKSTKIMSTEFDLIYVQEAIELAEDDWEALTTRLRNGVLPFQQIVGDTNPSSPRHWLKVRCNTKKTLFLDSIHEDNPTLWNYRLEKWTSKGEKYIARLDRLSGLRKQRLRFGLWVMAEGLIFPTYNPEIHLIDRREIPQDAPRFLSIDFGYVHPFVCQWWAILDDGVLVRYREVYMSGRTVRKHCEEIAKWQMVDPVSLAVCDHDAEDRATLEEELQISTLPARKDVRVGLQTVEDYLEVQENGRSRIYFFRDSLVEVDPILVENFKPLKTEDEFDSYVWAETEKKETPSPYDDHGMAATRYAVMYADEYSPTGGIHV